MVITTESPTYEPPSIATKTPSKVLRSSNAELVYWIDQENKRWLDAQSAERARYYDAMKAYLDIDNQSWPDKERQQLAAQGRHATSINIAKQKMETLSGSLLSEEYDFNFEPVDVDKDTLTRDIKHWYYQDKEQYNYSAADDATNMSGLLHSGVQEMYIDYKMRRTGAIAFRHCLEGSVLKDPYWQTDDYRDWRRAIKHGWYTASEIMDKWHTTDPQIQTLVDSEKLGGLRYESGDDVTWNKEAPILWGSKHLVIEYRWLETFKATRLHAHMPDGSWLALPLKIKEDEVREVMQRFQIQSWEEIREYPYEDDILYYAICVPDVSRTAILSKGRHPVQTGHIGFYNFSATRFQGIEKGMFEFVLDIQRTFNYRMSKIDDLISSAAGGASAYDKNKIDKGTARRLEKDKTRPDAMIPVDGEPNNVFALLPVQPVPEHLFREVNNLIDLFDRVSPVVPALEGAASAQESGILFELRHAVAKLGTLRLLRNWQQFLMHKAEGWYNQAAITYKGVYRRIPKVDGAGDVEFNVPDYQMGIMGDAQKIYVNSVEDLPRAQVIVGLKRSSPTEQMAKRLQIMDLNKIFSAHPELFKSEIRATNHELIQTLELEPAQKEYYNMMFEVQKEIDLLEEFARLEAAKSAIMNNKVMTQQATAMLQGIEQRMQQMQGGQPQAPQQSSPEMPQGGEAGGGGGAMPPPPGATQEVTVNPAIETFRGTFQP
jgi:hypothetical protein